MQLCIFFCEGKFFVVGKKTPDDATRQVTPRDFIRHLRTCLSLLSNIVKNIDSMVKNTNFQTCDRIITMILNIIVIWMLELRFIILIRCIILFIHIDNGFQMRDLFSLGNLSTYIVLAELETLGTWKTSVEIKTGFR